MVDSGNDSRVVFKSGGFAGRFFRVFFFVEGPCPEPRAQPQSGFGCSSWVCDCVTNRGHQAVGVEPLGWLWGEVLPRAVPLPLSPRALQEHGARAGQGSCGGTSAWPPSLSLVPLWPPHHVPLVPCEHPTVSHLSHVATPPCPTCPGHPAVTPAVTPPVTLSSDATSDTSRCWPLSWPPHQGKRIRGCHPNLYR